MASNDSLPDLGSGRFSFPSDLLSPEVKATKDYNLKYVKSAYWRHKENLNWFNWNKRSDWIVNRQYAHGLQLTQKYINWISKLKNAQNQTVTYLDLDWSIVSVIPKFRDVVLSYLAKIEYDVFADAINPEAAMDREQAKMRIVAEKNLMPFFKEMAAISGQPLDQQESDFMPETKDELDLWMQFSFRLEYELAMELGVSAALNENNWAEVRKLMREDAFDCGVMAADSYIDRISGRIRVKYVDPVNMILEDFRGHDGAVLPRIGYIEKMTVAQLKLEAGDQFSEEDYWNIANKFRGWSQNPQEITPYADYINTDVTQFYREYDNWEILIMKYQWDTVDRYKFASKKVSMKEGAMPRGELNQMLDEEYTKEVPFDTKLSPKQAFVDEQGLLIEKEVYATDIKCVYQAKWIVGTEMLYDYGKMTNIPRPAENQRECHKTIHFYRISNKSMIDRILPYADSLQLSWLKIQNLKARAMPRGMKIEIGAFDNVFIDSKLVTAQEIIQAGFQTGVWTYRRHSTMDDEGYDNSGSPIEETEGGMGTAYQELVESMAQDIASIRDVLGVNEFIDGSTPNKDALVGIAEVAVQGSQNALYPLMSGFVSVHERISLSICLLMQLLVKHGKYSGYTPAIGKIPQMYIEVGNEIISTEQMTPVMFGMRVVARATAEQKATLVKMINDALLSSQTPEAGGIELTDAIELIRLIEAGTNLKLVANLLGHRIKQYKREQQGQKQQLVEQQSQAIQQQTKAATQAKQQEIAMQLQFDKELDDHQTDNKIRAMQAEWSFKVQHETVKIQGKKEVEEVKETKV